MEDIDMDQIVNIDCYKVSNKLNLSLLESYFNIQKSRDVSDYLQLDSHSISSIIKVHSHSKSLFIYNFGCIVLVNFTSDETNLALKYLESIIGLVNFKVSSIFNERLRIFSRNNQIIKVNDILCSNKYNEETLPIACRLISKSSALASLEEEIIVVLDEAENIVNHLQKAKLRANTKNFLLSIAHIARFQHSAIKSLGLFDSTFLIKRNGDSKNFFNILNQYYEIEERTAILESKIDEVSKLISSYTTLSYNRQELQLLVFECILLSMFLLPHFIK
jgi:uncharacterized Rmd1/YagE family protein